MKLHVSRNMNVCVYDVVLAKLKINYLRSSIMEYTVLCAAFFSTL